MTNYAFDPEFQPALPLLPTVLDALAEPEAIAALRAQPGRLPFPTETRDDVVVTDHVAPGLDGEPDVPVRVYSPAEQASSQPGLLFVHGGGFMLGSVADNDSACQALSAEAGAVVASVEYRLAPEHPYPAAVNDVYAALTWFAMSADELGIDTGKIAIGGASAGAGIAAGVALMARDKGGPALCFQLLQIPELDDRLHTVSMQTFTDTPLWNLPNAQHSWRHYLGDLHGSPDVPYYAAPSRCEDLTGLPPAYISTMEFDPLRDEGILYGLALLQAGVSVELHSFPGTFHGSLLLPMAAVSQRETAEVVVALRRAFGV